jgi:hypothetical protein
MAEKTEKAAAQVAADTTTAPAGDHDRVVALSVRADGSLDQTAPELIGDKDAALAATKEQFAQQATAAVDTAAGPVAGEPEHRGGLGGPRHLRAHDRGLRAQGDRFDGPRHARGSRDRCPPRPLLRRMRASGGRHRREA